MVVGRRSSSVSRSSSAQTSSVCPSLRQLTQYYGGSLRKMKRTKVTVSSTSMLMSVGVHLYIGRVVWIVKPDGGTGWCFVGLTIWTGM